MHSCGSLTSESTCSAPAENIVSGNGMLLCLIPNIANAVVVYTEYYYILYRIMLFSVVLNTEYC